MEVKDIASRKSAGTRQIVSRPRGADIGVVRIIGGQWRSRRIAFPASEQVRPTPDRVRETLFNWLGQELNGMSCVDLFAGSGALGLEAASRGAAKVTLVETNPRVVAALAASKHMLGADQISVVKADALEFLARDQGNFDLVFVDPPFADGPPVAIMKSLTGRLTAGALVYYEGGQKYEAPPGWRVLKQDRAGMVHFHLLQLTQTMIKAEKK